MKLILVLFSILTFSSYSQLQTNPRAKWFTDARYGMFIHWGVYSGAEGYWKGEKLRNDNDYAEWLQYRNCIDKEEYLTILDRFRWDEIDPEKWVTLAKESGMKYIVITAKHHDGFAIWDSESSKYDIGDYTNHKRDIVGELAAACKKHGIRLGLYYSHWVDWEHEYGWDHTKEFKGISPEDYDKYWQQKVMPQMRELLTRYGEISMIWFDMWIHHSKTVITKEQLLQLKGLIRQLQPNCLVNSRLGLSVEEDPDVDFKELGDNQFGDKKENFPWQSPATVAHSWGYHAGDNQWKSTTTLLKSLIGNVSLNGNLLLNIGPRANGDVPFEISKRLLEMGTWLNVNGESIYGAEAFDLGKDQHDWGRITCKKTENGVNLFLHVYNWPLNKTLNLTGIAAKPKRIYLLADKQKTPLDFSFNEVVTRVDLPALAPDPYVSVVVVEYAGTLPVVSDLAAMGVEGGYSLNLKNMVADTQKPVIERKSRNGTIPEHLPVVEKTSLKWKMYVTEPGEKNIDISYSFQGKEGKGNLVMKCAGKTIQHPLKPTGKTVGEPNSNWVIDRFSSVRIGKIGFPEKGAYEVELELRPDKSDELRFQWIWVK
jgi:alpha-L-fucosidase